MPDSAERTLLNDSLNRVDMSTFLEDSKILVKSGSRFLVFTSQGDFFSGVHFDDNLLKEIDKRPRYQRNFYQRQSNIIDMEKKFNYDEAYMKPDLFKNNRATEPILDFLGNEYDTGERDPEPPLDDFNKMELLQMSFNNKFYIFQNRLLGKMFVYELVERRAKPKPSESSEPFSRRQGGQMLRKKVYKTFGKKRMQFVMRYQVQFEASEMFQHMI